MNITVLKVIFAAGIFIVTLLFTLIPLKIFQRDKSKPTSCRSRRMLSFSNCVSGGVFMAVCYVMLTPYVRERFQYVFDQANIDMKYPITEVVIVCGFFMVLPIEQLMHICQQSMKKSTHLELELLNSTDSSESENDEFDCENLVSQHKKKQSNGNAVSTHEHSHGSSHGHCHTSGLDLSSGLSLQSIVMVAALSTHSLFEGLAVGLQTEVEKLVHLYIGIITHEVLVAFAVGVNLTQQNCSLSTIVKLVLIFSIVIPIGIGIGMAIGMAESIAGQATSAVLQGLAAGTFLYVVFIDIIPAELNSPDDKMFKVFFMFAGFAVAAGLTFLMQD